MALIANNIIKEDRNYVSPVSIRDGIVSISETENKKNPLIMSRINTITLIRAISKI
jgi:hypothetical protein